MQTNILSAVLAPRAVRGPVGRAVWDVGMQVAQTDFTGALAIPWGKCVQHPTPCVRIYNSPHYLVCSYGTRFRKGYPNPTTTQKATHNSHDREINQ